MHDANQHFPPNAGSSIGTVGWRGSPCAAIAASSYDELGCFLPATFPDFAHSADEVDQATYRSPGGHLTRNDYIGVSRNAVVAPLSARVWREVQPAEQSDHYMIALSVAIPH